MIDFVRVSLVPFDSRCDFGQRQRSHLSSRGFREYAALPWTERLVGEELTAYEVETDHVLLFSPRGFGIQLRRHRFTISGLGHHDEIAERIVERDRHHRAVRLGLHEDVAFLNTLKHEMSDRSSRRKLRPDLWNAPPYTLSFFYAAGGAGTLPATDEEHCGLAALLEPGQVRRSDLADDPQEVAGCSDLIRTLDPKSYRKKYPDVDIKAGCEVRCSWAGVVALDTLGTDLPYLESLEIRLQMTWMRASFVRRWAETALDAKAVDPKSTDANELNSLAAQLTPLLRQTRRLIDATATTRDQRLYDALVASSDLHREIDGAEDALADVRDRVELARSMARKRYDRTIEALIFFLAVMQVVPLVMDVPFVTWSPAAVIPMALALTVVISLAARKL